MKIFTQPLPWGMTLRKTKPSKHCSLPGTPAVAPVPRQAAQSSVDSRHCSDFPKASILVPLRPVAGRTAANPLHTNETQRSSAPLALFEGSRLDPEPRLSKGNFSWAVSKHRKGYGNKHSVNMENGSNLHSSGRKARLSRAEPN